MIEGLTHVVEEHEEDDDDTGSTSDDTVSGEENKRVRELVEKNNDVKALLFVGNTEGASRKNMAGLLSRKFGTPISSESAIFRPAYTKKLQRHEFSPETISTAEAEVQAYLVEVLDSAVWGKRKSTRAAAAWLLEHTEATSTQIARTLEEFLKREDVTLKNPINDANIATQIANKKGATEREGRLALAEKLRSKPGALGAEYLAAKGRVAQDIYESFVLSRKGERAGWLKDHDARALVIALLQMPKEWLPLYAIAWILNDRFPGSDVGPTGIQQKVKELGRKGYAAEILAGTDNGAMRVGWMKEEANKLLVKFEKSRRTE